jgi:hypothetical protein
MEILKKEFLLLHTALIDNTPIELDPLTFQMKDYALWEKNIHDGTVGRNNIEYWNKHISSEFERFELSPYLMEKYYTPEQKEISAPAGVYAYFFDKYFLAEMKELCKNQFLVIVATLFLWIAYLSNKRRILLMLPLSNRDTPDLQNVVGYLISQLYLKMDIDETWTFNDLLDQTINNYSEAIDHRFYRRLDLNLAILPEYISATVNNLTYIKKEINYDRVSHRHVDIDEEPFHKIQFSINHYKNGWFMSCHYKSNVFKEVYALDLFDKYIEFLHAVIEDPDLKLSDLLAFN